MKFVLVGGLVAAYLALVYRTTRWTYIGWPHFDQSRSDKAGFIITFWHAHIAMMTPLARETIAPFHFLISEHKDGEFIAQTARHFKVKFARGSTFNPKKKSKSKGGTRALRQLLRQLRAGHGVGLTPDGPRGPRRQCQPGTIALAELAQLPVLPAAYASSPAIRFATWDKFKLPLPFGKGVFVFGEPIDIYRRDDLTKEGKCTYLNRMLDSVTGTAEALIEKM